MMKQVTPIIDDDTGDPAPHPSHAIWKVDTAI